MVGRAVEGGSTTLWRRTGSMSEVTLVSESGMRCESERLAANRSSSRVSTTPVISSTVSRKTGTCAHDAVHTPPWP